MKLVASYEMTPRYDTRQSFYGKAIISEMEDNICKVYQLFSYGTLVAIYSEDKMSNLKQYDYLGQFSQTTTRHQKEFFKQFGLWNNEIKDLFKKGHLEIGGNYGE